MREKEGWASSPTQQWLVPRYLFPATVTLAPPSSSPLSSPAFVDEWASTFCRVRSIERVKSIKRVRRRDRILEKWEVSCYNCTLQDCNTFFFCSLKLDCFEISRNKWIKKHFTNSSWLNFSIFNVEFYYEITTAWVMNLDGPVVVIGCMNDNGAPFVIIRVEM